MPNRGYFGCLEFRIVGILGGAETRGCRIKSIRVVLNDGYFGGGESWLFGRVLNLGYFGCAESSVFWEGLKQGYFNKVLSRRY